MKWHLVPGINVTKKGYVNSIGNWSSIIESTFNVEVVPHPKFRPIGTAWLLDSKFADEIAKTIHPDDVIIGHSDGAVVAHEVNKRVSYRGAVLLNAALDRRTAFRNVDWVHNWFLPKDKIIFWSKYLPFKEWGRLGQRGFSRFIPNHYDFNMSHYEPKPKTHFDLFYPQFREIWATRIGKKIFEQIGISMT